MMRRRKGFTLIELLVVIAIIGILAAMIFPVFARARDTARKAVCLSNMRNINTAMQMYLQEWDMVTPCVEHRPEVIEWFHEQGGWSPPANNPGAICNHIRQANPYIRWALVLDPYIRNRQMWSCPAARTLAGATWIIGEADWFTYVQDHWDEFVWPCMPCNPGLSWPNGWGGTITDSLSQGNVIALGLQSGALGTWANSRGSAQGVFIQTIGHTDWPELKVDQQVDDPAWFVFFGDAGGGIFNNWNAHRTLWPEVCHFCWGCWADHTNCLWTRSCGVSEAQWNSPSGVQFSAMARDQHTRHMGGVNLGFADGHVRYFRSEAVMGMIANCATGAGCQAGKESLTASIGCAHVQ
jgi:prepilin-type N-terminal cleavage/methylation domain-containing protein/prepilin-type processing-associated H-X9-DG protein